MANCIHDTRPAFVAVDAFKSVVHEVARRAAARLEMKRNLPAALMAQTSLGVLRASGRADVVGVSRRVRSKRDLVCFVDVRRRTVFFPVGLLGDAWSQSIGAASRGSRYVAESATPEGEEKQRVESVRAKGSMWKLRSSCKKCVGLTSNGHEARGPDGVYTMLSEH